MVQAGEPVSLLHLVQAHVLPRPVQTTLMSLECWRTDRRRKRSLGRLRNVIRCVRHRLRRPLGFQDRFRLPTLDQRQRRSTVLQRRTGSLCLSVVYGNLLLVPSRRSRPKLMHSSKTLRPRLIGSRRYLLPRVSSYSHRRCRYLRREPLDRPIIVFHKLWVPRLPAVSL